MTSNQHTTTCCIAGGGPAGMMLGYLLARAGELSVPLPLRVVTRLPALQRMLARLLGMGVRPERVELKAGEQCTCA